MEPDLNKTLKSEENNVSCFLIVMSTRRRCINKYLKVWKLLPTIVDASTGFHDEINFDALVNNLTVGRSMLLFCRFIGID